MAKEKVKIQKIKKEEEDKVDFSCSNSRNNIPLGAAILIILGVMFLLQNFGILSGRLFSYIWRLWPLILILIGIKILSKGK